MSQPAFRNNGATGALLDEYEKALRELQTLIAPLSGADLTRIIDPHTPDPDCVSIQTVLTHVVRSGYNYVVAIRNHLGENLPYRDSVLNDSVEAYHEDLNQLMVYNESLFSNYPVLVLEEQDEALKIKVRWGQRYDIEQLFEHAIVHILRHRRQIEKMIAKLI